MLSSLTLIDLQRHFSYFLSENKCSLLSQSLVESPGDLTKDDIANGLECPLKVILGTIHILIHCPYLKMQHI